MRTVTATGTSTVFDVRSVFEFLDDGPHTLRIVGIQGTIAIDAFFGVPIAPPDLVSLFNEDFDDGQLPGWMQNADGLESFVLPSGSDYALQLNGVYGRFQGLGGIDDIVIRSSVKIESGSAVFDINQSAEGEYQLVIESNGTVTLKRNSTTLGTVALAPFSPSQWFTLEWQNIDGRLKVFIDDELAILANDSNPLQYGTFMVNNDVTDKAFWIDDFEVLLTQAEFDEMFGNPSPPPSTPTPVPTATPPPGGVPESSQNSGEILYRCSLLNKCIKDVETGAFTNIFLDKASVGGADWMPSGDAIIYTHSIQGMCTDPLRRSTFFGRLTKVNDQWQDQGDFARPPVQYTDNNCDYGAVFAGGLAVSPDGTKVAFAVYLDFENSSSAIWILDLSNCSQDNCASYPLTADNNVATSDHDPAWSPDSTMIVFRSNRTGSDHIHTVNVAGGNATVAPIPYVPLDGVQAYRSPDWSTNDTIAVAWTNLEIVPVWTYQRRIDIIGLDGSIIDALALTYVESTNSLITPSPAWSPDGSQLIYKKYSELYLYDLDTDTQTIFAQGSEPRWWGDPCPSGPQESTCQQEEEIEIDLEIEYRDKTLSYGFGTEETVGMVPLYDNVWFNISVTNNGLDTINAQRVSLVWEWTEKTILPEWEGLDLEYANVPLSYNQSGTPTPRGACDQFPSNCEEIYINPYPSNPSPEQPGNYCNSPSCGLTWWLQNSWDSLQFNGGTTSILSPVQYQLQQSGTISISIYIEQQDQSGAWSVIAKEDYTLEVPITQMVYPTNSDPDPDPDYEFRDQRLASVIFWIVYIESSQGQWEDYDGLNSAGLNTDFLRTNSTYCDSNSTSSSSKEDPDIEWSGWTDPTRNTWRERGILSFRHCSPPRLDGTNDSIVDTYYVYYWTYAILNGFLDRERQYGPNKYAGYVFSATNYSYMTDDPEQPGYIQFWNDEICRQHSYVSSTYESARPDGEEKAFTSTDFDKMLDWMDGYLDCYLQIQPIPQALQTEVQNIRSVYNRLSPRIEQAMADFATNIDVENYYPVFGSGTFRAANHPTPSTDTGATSISLYAGGEWAEEFPANSNKYRTVPCITPSTQVTQSDIENSYDGIGIGGGSDPTPSSSNNCSGPYEDFIDTLRIYAPTLRTPIIRPIIWVQGNGFRWVAQALQISDDHRNIPR